MSILKYVHFKTKVKSIFFQIDKTYASCRHHRQAVPLHHLKPEEGTIYDKVLPSDRDSEGRGDECDQTPDTTVCLSEAALPWQSGTSTCFVGPF